MGFSLLPETTMTTFVHNNIKDMPTKTYWVDWDLGRINKYCDRMDAMKQAISKCMQTNLYAHDIYDARYGFEMNGLLGKNRSYVESEVKRRIQEMFSYDERIMNVRKFKFHSTKQRDAIEVHFCVNTIFGEDTQYMEVSLT